jgi:DNA ligase D-like protein (predicted 3'-phosphoesterase)
MSLVEYTRKRDFKKTAEPEGKRASGSASRRFVVRKHAASRLHYDFRLEMGGTLKSWALPKGVPFVKGEKRLAVQVEDHPVSYLDFEGTIPKGQYGGGTVMVWDIGSFEALSSSPEKALASGKLHFALSGKKLRGEWHLVRFRDGKQWLLIKGGQDLRPVSKRLDDTSALSGKSMKQLAANNSVWRSNRDIGEPVAPDKSSRHYFGALLLGYYDGKELKFAGKVGTGFDAKKLEMIHVHLSQLASEGCPFANLPEKKNGRYGQNITPADMKRCHWVKPKLVCQVKFSEWTRDGKLRQPVFLGLRDDKAATDVVREEAR